MSDSSDFQIQSSANILGFVHRLRAAEFDVSTEDAALIGRALTGFSNPDLTLSRSTCRALCCRSKQQWQRFDALFDAYWFPQYGQDHESPESDMDKSSSNKGGLAGIGSGTDVFDGYKRDDASVGAGAGRQTTLAKADFRFLNNRAAMRSIEELAECLAQQIRSRLSRRRKLTRQNGQLAVGPTLRASVRSGGLPLQPWYARRRREPQNLVVLHDVSHSMTFNNPLLFRFTRGLVRRFNTAEAFVFHTQLYRVTPIFRETSIARMREMLEQNNRLWLGGTCIADSLAEFRVKFARQFVKTDSLVIIISDGFDSNEPEQLIDELQWLRKRCRRGVWLNPMLERAGFNPEKEAVWNIRRNVDRLLPAHSLDALRRCVQVMSE